MGKFSFDFNNVKTDLPPEGEHEVVINKVVLRSSKEKRKPYLNWEFDLMTPDFEGRKVWGMTSMAFNAMFTLNDFFDGLGLLSEDEGGEENTFEFDFSEDVEFTMDEDGPYFDWDGTTEILLLEPDVAGIACRVRLKHREFGGSKRADVVAIVEAYNAFDDEDDGFEDEESDELERLNDRDEVEEDDTDLE